MGNQSDNSAFVGCATMFGVPGESSANNSIHCRSAHWTFLAIAQPVHTSRNCTFGSNARETKKNVSGVPKDDVGSLYEEFMIISWSRYIILLSEWAMVQ